MWKSICLKNDLPLGKLKQLWGGGNIFLMKIKIKLPGRAKFRNHDYQISFLKNYSIIWCYYFWRVLLVITNPPPAPLLLIIPLCPPIYTYLPTPFISGKLTWPQKNLEISPVPPPHCSGGGGGGGGGVMTWELCLKCERAPRSVFETHI